MPAKAGIQYSQAPTIESRARGVLGRPPSRTMTEVERKALDAAQQGQRPSPSLRGASATKQSIVSVLLWIASRSLSSGARSRDPLARNDDNRKRPPGFPDGLSCPTVAPHSRAISGHLRQGSAPSRILIGCRCTSGQSRTAARTVAMVSHLRKMIDWATMASTVQERGDKYPRCSRCSQTAFRVGHRAKSKNANKRHQPTLTRFWFGSGPPGN